MTNKGCVSQVSSTSNASLSSSVKKRKAPAPPPVVKETRPEVPEVREACKTNGHDSDATSGVSEESASEVSAVSSTKAENAAEQPASRKVSSASSSSRVASPGELDESQKWNRFLIELGEVLCSQIQQQQHRANYRMTAF